VDNAIAELRRDFEEEQEEEREEELLREQYESECEDFNSAISDAATSEQVIAIVDRYLEAFFMRREGGMPAWMVNDAAERIQNIEFPEGLRRGEMDLRPVLGCFLELARMTNRIPISNTSRWGNYGADIGQQRWKEAFSSPVTAYLRLHMPDAADWNEERIRPLIEGAARVSSSEFMRGILDRAKQESEDFSRFLSEFLAEDMRQRPFISEVSRKLIVLDALEDHEVKDPLSPVEADSAFYVSFGNDIAGKFNEIDNRDGREAALARMEVDVDLICEYVQRTGIALDRVTLAAEISKACRKHGDGYSRGGRELHQGDLGLIKALRIFAKAERSAESVYALSPRLLEPIHAEDNEAAISYAGQLADAVGFSWKPGEIWPNKEDREQMVIAAMREYVDLPWSSDADATFDLLRDQFGVTPDDMRSVESFISVERVRLARSPEKKAEIVWNRILERINDDTADSTKMVEVARTLVILERAYGTDVIRRAEATAKPPLEKIIRLLTSYDKQWAREKESLQKVKFSEFFLRACYRDLKDEFAPAVERAMEGGDFESLRSLFKQMRYSGVSIILDPDYFRFHLIRSYDNDERLQWVALWSEFSEGVIPIDDATKLHLLTDVLRVAHSSSSNSNGGTFRRMLELLRSDDPSVLEKQRNFIRRSSFVRSAQYRSSLHDVYATYGLRPTVLPSPIFDSFLSGSCSLEEMLEVFPQELLYARMNAIDLNAVHPSILRKFVLEARAFLEKCASQAADPDRSATNLLLRLSALRAPSANTEHDPWSNESLSFLFRECVSSVGPDVGEWADALVSYVNMYGMIYQPELMRLHLGITRAHAFDDLPTGTREMLRELGITVSPDETPERWPYQSPAEITTELKRYVSRMSGALLRDEVPKGISTRIGQELFKSILGETKWGRGDSFSSLFESWKANILKNPNAAKLPLAYRPTQFKVRIAERSFAAPSKDVRQQVEKILNSREVAERYLPLASSLVSSMEFNQRPDGRNTWAVAALDNIRARMDREIADLTFASTADAIAFDQAIAAEEDTSRREVLAKRKKASENPKAREGFSKKAAELAALRPSLEITFRNAAELAPVIRWLAENDSFLADGGARLREATFLEMLENMPEGMRLELEATFIGGIEPTVERLEALSMVLREYVREHYLSPDQDPRHTGHAPFAKETYRSVMRAWQIPKTDVLPIEDIVKKARVLITGSEDESITNRLRNVFMVPVAGLLRTYAGDVGDACYTSQHLELARGDYQKLRAWIYAVADTSGNMTPRGSMLGLEVRCADGAEGLVARANNPKESFIRSIDAKDFVLASLREAVETARRIQAERVDRGEPPVKQRVLVPIDRATESSTNRTQVASVYHARFQDNPRIALERSPESTFKYDLTNSRGAHPCVVVWESDEEGKETWFGKWE